MWWEARAQQALNRVASDESSAGFTAGVEDMLPLLLSPLAPQLGSFSDWDPGSDSGVSA